MEGNLQVSERLVKGMLFATVLLVGACLLAYNLGHWSFWFDESFTSTLIKFGYSEIPQRTAFDVHPPLYYLVLKFWSSIFGSSDAALRAMSAFFMLSAASLTFWVVKRMTGFKVALVSFGFVVIAPFFVRYGQETRMYGLAAFLLALSTLIIYVQSLRKRAKRSTLLWAIYAVLIAAALYTHYFTFSILIAHALYFLYVDSKLEIFNKKLTLNKLKKYVLGLDRRWIAASLTSVILFIPWLPKFLHQATRVNGGFWIPPANTNSFLDTFSEMFAFNDFPHNDSAIRHAIGLLFTVAFIVFAVWIWKMASKRQRGHLILLAGPTLIAMVILFVYSLLPSTSSIYYFRYFTSSALLLYSSVGYIAWILWENKSKQIAAVFTASLVAVMIYGTYHVVQGETRSHNSANRAIALLNDVIVTGDGLVAYDFWQTYDTLHYIKEGFVPQTRLEEPDQYGGETLLLARDDVVIEDYSEVTTKTGTIWYLSSTDPVQFEDLPSNWEEVDVLFEESTFKITRYRLN